MARKKRQWKPCAKTHDDMVAEWMKDPAFRAEYDALEEEFQLLREMLQARKRADMTQEEVAECMGTKGSAVARLESSHDRDKSSPSINTLRKYAHAVGCHLEIRFKPLALKEPKEKHA